MNIGVGAILIGVLVAVMIFIYLAQREKNAVKRKKRRKFRPEWKEKNGATFRRRRKP